MDLGLRGVTDRLARRILRVVSALSPIIPKPPQPKTNGDSPLDLSSLPPAIREIERTNDQAGRNYVPQPYHGPVTVFLSRRFGYGYHFRVPRRLVTGRMEIHKVPGDHTSMLEEPRVRILAAKLSAVLDKTMETSAGRSVF